MSSAFRLFFLSLSLSLCKSFVFYFYSLSPSLSLFSCLSIYQSIHLFIYLSIYLSINYSSVLKTSDTVKYAASECFGQELFHRRIAQVLNKHLQRASIWASIVSPWSCGAVVEKNGWIVGDALLLAQDSVNCAVHCGKWNIDNTGGCRPKMRQHSSAWRAPLIYPQLWSRKRRKEGRAPQKVNERKGGEGKWSVRVWKKEIVSSCKKSCSAFVRLTKHSSDYRGEKIHKPWPTASLYALCETCCIKSRNSWVQARLREQGVRGMDGLEMCSFLVLWCVRRYRHTLTSQTDTRIYIYISSLA